MIARAAILILTIVFAGGCAFGNVASLSVEQGFDLEAGEIDRIAVGVRDRREDVVSGGDKETLVGHQRSLYGIPYDVQNASGQPLAADLAQMIADGFRKKGTDVLIVKLSPFGAEEKAVDALLASKRDRVLFFNIYDWNADTYSQTTLHYDVELRVLDVNGRKLADSRVTGEDELTPKQRPERRTVTAATSDILRSLVTARSVVAAMNGRASGVAAEKCTVEQILRMQESGLSQAQIEAACGSSQ